MVSPFLWRQRNNVNFVKSISCDKKLGKYVVLNSMKPIGPLFKTELKKAYETISIYNTYAIVEANFVIPTKLLTCFENETQEAQEIKKQTRLWSWWNPLGYFRNEPHVKCDKTGVCRVCEVSMGPSGYLWKERRPGDEIACERFGRNRRAVLLPEAERAGKLGKSALSVGSI